MSALAASARAGAEAADAASAAPAPPPRAQARGAGGDVADARRRLVALGNQSTVELLRRQKAAGWRLVGRSGGADVYEHTQLSLGPPCCMAKVFVAAPPQRIFAALCDPLARSLYDTRLHCPVALVAPVEPPTASGGTSVVLVVHARPAGLFNSHRDYCLLVHAARADGGSDVYAVCEQSIEHPGCPPSGACRGRAQTGGFVIEPVTDFRGGAGSLLTFVAHYDLCGSISRSASAAWSREYALGALQNVRRETSDR